MTDLTSKSLRNEKERSPTNPELLVEVSIKRRKKKKKKEIVCS